MYGKWHNEQHEAATLADLAAEEQEAQYDQAFLTWGRMTYSQRHTIKTKDVIDEVMGEALQELYESPEEITQFNGLLYRIFSDEHDIGAVRALQAILEPYIKQAARPHVEAA
jgi:hypothetical protein